MTKTREGNMPNEHDEDTEAPDEWKVFREAVTEDDMVTHDVSENPEDHIGEELPDDAEGG